MTKIDLNLLVEDGVDALIRIADAAEKEVGQEIARLQEENEQLRDEIKVLKEEE